MPTPTRLLGRALRPALALLLLGACRAPFVPNDGGTPPPPPTTPLLPFRIGSSGPDFARSVATDASGNVFVAGYFAGTVDFDQSAAGATGRTAIGPYDISIAKYASDGTFQWVYAIGGTDADVPSTIKAASDGSAYVAGYVTAGALCSGNVIPNAGDHDVFLMHVSAAGLCEWAIGVGSSGPDEAHDLLIEPDGDVDITGSFSGTVDFDPGPGTGILISRGSTDGFVARYSASGTFKSVVQFGGTGDDAGNALALTTEGDVVVAGTFNGTATFGSSLAPQLLMSQGGLDYFVARFAPTLGLEWAIRAGGTSDDVVSTGGLLVDAADNIYVTGTFSGTADVSGGTSPALVVSQGGTDVFLAKYTGGGTFAGLARAFGGSGNEGVSGFARDAGGNLYLSGWFQNTVDFDPGSTNTQLTALGSGGASDGYLLSLNSNGDLRWVNPFSAVIAGSTNFTIASGVALPGDGNLWVVGRFFGLMDMDPSTAAVDLQSLGDADQFVAKYDATTGAIVR
ncbi:MAG TPA: hypothetical protein VHW65_01975 [Gemmatimonadales bacterium]|jgi:hypothetical protein|nr:hypothetical protein [Gemmatimonadales bacterium]